MAESTTLLNAQIAFLDTRLALIHIPLEAYPYFVLPLLQLLFHDPQVKGNDQKAELSRPWTFWHPFVNVSITTDECSVVCPRREADQLFLPILSGLRSDLRQRVSISQVDYSAIVIDGEGLEAGRRVLDLTSPLALAGISIFFITSYWSDFILVPLHTRTTVIQALEERGFVFEQNDRAGEIGHMNHPSSPLLQSNRNGSKSTLSHELPVPGTPPPSTITELQERTFKLLEKNNISPVVDASIDLVTCAGIKDHTASSSTTKFISGKLDHGIMRCITAPQRPRFFSLTLTATESASLTMERQLLRLFPQDGEDILLGKDGAEQVSITLDLRDLPLESTGIVCGVSSRLIESMTGKIGSNLFNMSYLSTARAGHVIVYEDELSDVMKALKGVQVNRD